MSSEATLVRHRLLLPRPLLALLSDERLVAEVRAGSERAFEVLFDRHYRPLLSFCRHLLGSVEEAEDAVQHTFLAAYRDLVGSRKAIIVRPWLYTIARHRCLSMLRARGDRRPVDGHEPAIDNLAAQVAVRDDLRSLLGDVGRLPEDQRTALVLMELGDLSHAEIAAVIGCPRQRVKALVFQARSSLAASRAARDTPCQEIRPQLAAPDGDGASRAVLRRHLTACAACRAFGDDVSGQRRNLALLLPVLPSPGLKAAVLGSVLGGGAGGGGTAVTAGALLGADLAAKALVAAAVVGGGGMAGATAMATSDESRPTSSPTARKPVALGRPLHVKLAATEDSSALAPHDPAATDTVVDPRQLGVEAPGRSGAKAATGGRSAITSADTARLAPGTDQSQPPEAPGPRDASVGSGGADKAAKADKPAKPAPGTSKPNKAAKRANPGKPDKAAKPAKPAPGTAKPDKPAAGTAKPDKTGKPTKPAAGMAKPDKTGKPTKPAAGMAKPDKTGKPTKPAAGMAKPDKTGKPTKPAAGMAKPDKTGKPTKRAPGIAKPDKTGKPAKPAAGTAKPDKAAKPTKPAPGTAMPDKAAKPASKPDRAIGAEKSPSSQANSGRDKPVHATPADASSTSKQGPDADPSGQTPAAPEPAPAPANGGGNSDSGQASGTSARNKPEKTDKHADSVGGGPSDGPANPPAPES